MASAKADFQDDFARLDGQLLQANVHEPALTGASQQVVPTAQPVVGGFCFGLGPQDWADWQHQVLPIVL
jgi:hypothetical protein